MQIKHIMTALALLSISPVLAQEGRILKTDLYKSTNSKKAENYFYAGQNSFQKRDFTKAVEFYRLALFEDTTFIDAYDNLGVSFRQLNMLDSAEFYYLASHRKYPQGTSSIQNLGVIHEIKKNYEKASEFYKLIMEIEPKNPEGYFSLSRVQLAQRKYDEALKNGQIAEKYYKDLNSAYIGDCYYLLCLIGYYSKNKELAQTYLKLTKDSGLKVDPDIEKALK